MFNLRDYMLGAEMSTMIPLGDTLSTHDNVQLFNKAFSVLLNAKAFLWCLL